MFLPRLIEASTKPDFCFLPTLNLKNTVHLGHVHPHIWLQLVESFSNMGLPIYLRNSWQWSKRTVLATKQHFKAT